MSKKAVELRVAGQSCRVVTTASEEDLAELGAMVEAKLAGVMKPGRPVNTQALLLAAIALANDVRELTQERAALAQQTEQVVTSAIARVDEALALCDDVEQPTAAKTPRRQNAPAVRSAAKKAGSKASRPAASGSEVVVARTTATTEKKAALTVDGPAKKQ